METSGKALIEFWDWAGKKGIVNENTAVSRRIACNKVLEVVDDWEGLDVSTLKIDDVFRRFTNKRKQDFTPASLQTYRSRFTSAIADFLEYSKNPEGWKPSTADRPTSTRKEKVAKTSRNEHVPQREGVRNQSATPGREGLVEYPFPLRGNRWAYLSLPADLETADVNRLKSYLSMLVENPETNPETNPKPSDQ